MKIRVSNRTRRGFANETLTAAMTVEERVNAVKEAEVVTVIYKPAERPAADEQIGKIVALRADLTPRAPGVFGGSGDHYIALTSPETTPALL